MNLAATLARSTLCTLLALFAVTGLAADYSAPQEGTAVVRDFRFHTGETLAEVRMHYRTIGAPTGEPVLMPKSAQFASVFYGIATNGGDWSYYKAAPTREKADQMLNQRLTAAFTADANDTLYQWDASRDYNPSAGLERIEATLLAINAADDERNPPQLGVLDREIKRVKYGRVLLIPASDQTLGHGTTGQARFWKSDLDALLKSAPRKAP